MSSQNTSAAAAAATAANDTSSNSPRYRVLNPRDSLGPYITNPEFFVPKTVIRHNPAFVYIRDLFPKSLVHTLLLPRDFAVMKMHPFDAFENPVLLRVVKAEAEVLKGFVVADLKRQFGEQNGRDWKKDVKIGVHAKPSMNHLHVHVLSRDHYSDKLTTAKHYSSFNSPFFVGLDEFPLAPDDLRRTHPLAFTKGDLICWRCKKNFGNDYATLRKHLVGEFNEWKKEGGGDY